MKFIGKIISRHVYLILILALVGCTGQPTTEKAKYETKQAEKAIYLGDYAAAVEFARKPAEQGYAPAQTLLGKIYLKPAENPLIQALINMTGTGVTQNYPEAIKWFQKAAVQGDAEAQFYLGNMYRNGKGVTQNSQEAVKWYRKAAEQGHAYAQFFLGIMYGTGEGVTKNGPEAMKWFQKSAKNGNADAQKILRKLDK